MLKLANEISQKCGVGRVERFQRCENKECCTLWVLKIGSLGCRTPLMTSGRSWFASSAAKNIG
jgi:hypothetical protein